MGTDGWKHECLLHKYIVSFASLTNGAFAVKILTLLEIGIPQYPKESRSALLSVHYRSDKTVFELRNIWAFENAELEVVMAEERKSFMVALILSVVVGSFGIDRFYLGYIGLGVAKLITLGGCGIWWLIDLVLIATGKMTDANGNELEK